MIVNPLKTPAAYLFLVLIIPFPGVAGEFDGSKTLYGYVEKIIEINQFTIKDDVNPDTAGLPRKFVIDFNERMIRPSMDSLVRRTCKIKRIEHMENKLILQGADEGVENIDDGIAWSIVILQKTGEVVLSASGGAVAYVAFGRCTSEPGSRSSD
jgi:hypothetical protein